MLLLAAGGSRRLGRPKQFLRLRGASLLALRIRQAAALDLGPPLVVTGARRLAVSRAARMAGADTVHHPGWRAGMGSSLARGVSRVSPGRAVLVMTVDQYRLRREDLARLLAAWRRQPARPVAAAYAGHLGVPAILPARWRSRLLRMAGDRGAAALLHAAGRQVTPVPLPRAAIDVDYPEDWRAR